jgi:GxxExxY protein
MQGPIGAEQVVGKHDQLTKAVIGVFYDVYNELGSGFLESVYKECMRIALIETGLRVQAEMPIPVHFRGNLVGAFRADLVVNGVVLIELKVGDALIKEHETQTLNYLRATDLEVALLMNFGPTPRFKRLVMDNEKKKNRSVASVEIGVKPFVDEAVTEWV